MRYLMLVGIFVSSLLVGCAHSLMRGSVAMKVNSREAHICMGNGEVQAGDKVALYTNACTSSVAGKEESQGSCKKIKLGEGIVSRTLNEHYSVIEVNKGVKFKEGSIVEKL